jgi:CHAT domain-containing protein
MKNVWLILGFCFPVFLMGQGIDSVVVKRVDSLLLVARELANKGDFDKALEVNTSAEKLALQKFGQESIAYGKTCFNRGRILYFQSNYPESEKWYLLTKSIWEKILDKMHPYYASCLNNLALLYGDMGDYDKAEPMYNEAIAIREKLFGKKHTDYVASVNNLATLFIEKGYYEKAESLLLEIQIIRENLFGKDSPDYARGLNNLAVLYHFMGEYEKVEPFLLGAIAIREKLLGKDNPEYARALNNLANYYDEMGDYKKVESLYLEAKTIREKILDKDHPDYAQSLANLGTLYMNLQQNEKAESFLQESLTICEKTLGNSHPNYAMQLGNLAGLYHNMGDLQKAKIFYLKAKDIYAAALGKEHPDYAMGLINLGALYVDLKDYPKAEQFFLEGLAIRKKVLGTDHSSYASALSGLARLDWHTHHFEATKSYLLEADKIEKKLLLNATRHLSERELLAYVQNFERGLNQHFSFTQIQSGLAEVSFNDILFHKGFLLNGASKMHNLTLANPIFSSKSNELKSYHRRLAAEYTKPIDERKNVTELEEKANALEKDLARSIAGFSEVTQQVTWQEVRQKLKPNEAAIEFVHYQFVNPNPTDSTMYAALVLRPGMKQPTLIPLFEAKQLDTLLKTQGKTKPEYINQLYALSNPKKSLYQLIWKPLEQELIGTTTVYYSPSGLLHRLNLNAIPLPTPTLAQNKNQTLADRYQLIELGSTRQLVIAAPKTTVDTINAKNTIAAQLYGSIQYEMDSSAVKVAAVDLTKNTSTSPRGIDFGLADSSLRGGKWNYLKWTEVEINTLELILTDAGLKADVHKAYGATEESFKRIGADKPSPRIVHLATHGFFFPDPKLQAKNEPTLNGANEPVFKISEHPMIRSGLILSGGNHAWQTGKSIRPGLEDGILTAYEISQMNLSNTELVVLSACETGLGDIQGNEGVYGLQRAFKIAGAKYLVMSLWQVPDFHTQELMTTFYSKWLEDKMSLPDAFRAALKVMKDKFKDPFYWAGFVLVE